MRKKIKILGFLILFCAAFIQINLNEKTNSAEISVIKLITSALAESESCMGSTFLDRYPKTGSPCVCNGKFVTPQSCESTGNGCTTINCP